MKVTLIPITCAVALTIALMQPTPTQAQSNKPAVVSLNEMKSTLTKLQDRISAVTESLQQVKDSAKNEAALNKAATEFQSRYKALDAQVELARSQAILVKARAKDHYEAWQKSLGEVQNPNIREKAQRRYNESREEFDKIIAVAERSKEDFLPFVSELKDISLYLEADASEDAVKSLSNTIWKLGNKSRSVLASIGNVNEQIDKALKSLPKK